MKSNKFLTENIQETQDTMKRPYLIVWIEEALQFKGRENIFNKIREENFAN